MLILQAGKTLNLHFSCLLFLSSQSTKLYHQSWLKHRLCTVSFRFLFGCPLINQTYCNWELSKSTACTQHVHVPVSGHCFLGNQSMVSPQRHSKTPITYGSSFSLVSRCISGEYELIKRQNEASKNTSSEETDGQWIRSYPPQSKQVPMSLDQSFHSCMNGESYISSCDVSEIYATISRIQPLVTCSYLYPTSY